MGQEHTLPSGLRARAFKTSHTVESQGYVVYSQRKKLKRELQGKTQDEIRELRLAGEDVTEVLQVRPHLGEGERGGGGALHAACRGQFSSHACVASSESAFDSVLDDVSVCVQLCMHECMCAHAQRVSRLCIFLGA